MYEYHGVTFPSGDLPLDPHATAKIMMNGSNYHTYAEQLSVIKGESITGEVVGGWWWEKGQRKAMIHIYLHLCGIYLLNRISLLYYRLVSNYQLCTQDGGLSQK